MDNCKNLHIPSKYTLFHQCVTVMSGSLIVSSHGMHYGWPSPSLPLLVNKNSTIPTSESDGSWIAVMPLLGLPVGNLIASALVNSLGRKTVILISSPIAFLTWLGIAYANHVVLLECIRFIAGIADGMTLVALPIYVGELSHKKIRAFLCSFSEVAFKLGLLAINVIGAQFDIKTTALFASSISVLHFTTFIWMPESPHFLDFYKMNSERKVLLNFETQNADLQKKNGFISFLLKIVHVCNGKVERRALLIVCGLTIIHHFSGYLPIVFHCFNIFSKSSGSVTPQTATIIYLSTQAVVTGLSGILIDNVGRKPLFIISTIGTSCALAIQGAYFYLKDNSIISLDAFGYIPLAALLLHTIFFSFGLGTCVVIMTSELFPLKVKGLCISISYTLLALGGAVVSKFFIYLMTNYQMHVPFFVFAACCVSGLLFIIFYVPETKRKTLDQIQQSIGLKDFVESKLIE